MEHENEHLDIREKLLRLPKLQADDNFLKRLQIQIDILDSEEKTRDVVVKDTASSYFKNLFGTRLMPALGISSVVVAAFLVYFILADKKDAVVNDIANNKNTETVITIEKPGITNSAPTQNNELAKTDETAVDKTDKATTNNSQENNLNNNTRQLTSNREVTQNEPNKISQPVVTEDKIVPPSSDIKSNKSIDVEQNNKLTVTPPEGGITAKKNEEVTKSDDLLKKDNTKSANPITSTDSEKTIIEGGRGSTDSKVPKANIKPKKKDVNGVIKINKNVLETLRDKLK